MLLDLEPRRFRMPLVAEGRAVDEGEMRVVEGILHQAQPGAGPGLVEFVDAAEAFRLDTVNGVAVVFRPAEGQKCARSWKITPEVGSDPEFPDITPRDAEAVREWQVRFEKTV